MGPGGSTGEFYQTLKEDIILIIYNLFRKIKREIPNSSSVASIILILKAEKKTVKENKVKQNISKSNPANIKKRVHN